jgi:hypothetical protein
MIRIPRVRPAASLLIVVAVAFAPVSGTQPASVSDTSNIPSTGVKQVEVRVARGSVTVRGTPAGGIELRTTRHSTATDPRTVIVRAAQANGVIRIVTVHPPRPSYPIGEPTDYDPELGDFWLHDVIVDVDLSIPPSTDVWLRTMSGNLTVSTVSGILDVASSVGNIHVDDATAQVTATTLGNINVNWTDLSGPMTFPSRLATYGGSIRISIPRDESVQIRGEQIIGPRSGEVEIARTDDGGTYAAALTIGHLKRPVEVVVNGGSLLLLGKPR